MHSSADLPMLSFPEGTFEARVLRDLRSEPLPLLSRLNAHERRLTIKLDILQHCAELSKTMSRCSFVCRLTGDCLRQMCLEYNQNCVSLNQLLEALVAVTGGSGIQPEQNETRARQIIAGDLIWRLSKLARDSRDDIIAAAEDFSIIINNWFPERVTEQVTPLELFGTALSSLGLDPLAEE